jgi:CRP-like cAMP-binding protein
MTLLANHPQRSEITERLRQNIVLRRLDAAAFGELDGQLAIMDYKKGDVLLSQGAHDMEQYFVIDGILKRVVASPEGKEMILRFAAEDDMDTSYAAWKLRTPAPYSIRAVTKAQVAKMPLPQWAQFLDAHPDLKDDFEYEIMHLMSEVMAHTITLHLLDAPGTRASLRAQALRPCRARAEEGARLVPATSPLKPFPVEAIREDLKRKAQHRGTEKSKKPRVFDIGS